MYEIELKAHVSDRNGLLDKLNKIAVYEGKTDKKDTYWQLEIPGIKTTEASRQIRVRIRQEQTDTGKTVLLTYKRKELKTDINGTAFEVNEEKECSISDPEPLEQLLTDAGFVPVAKKHKIVYDWKQELSDGTLLFELCTVPPLGDFIEIERLSPVQDKETVDRIRGELEQALTSCGIPAAAIEPRYYTDLLREAGQQEVLR